jgi:DNA invertase Pin-like site-specific DNA recombinase
MKFIAYRRVSTKAQGDNYSLEGQQRTIEQYVTGQNGEILASFCEIESGANDERPKLKEAIAIAKAKRAVLVIAKLDRISRNASFLMQLQDSGIPFVCCDLPSADRFTVSILACVAERERLLIAERVRSGLAIAKARGVKLGSANILNVRLKGQEAIQARKMAFAHEAIQPIREIQSTGVQSLNKISQYLNLRGIRGARGGKWTAKAVSRTIACVK